MYGGAAFQAAVDAVLDVTDRVGATLSDAELGRMREHHRTTARYRWSIRSGMRTCSRKLTTETTIAPRKAAPNPPTANGSPSPPAR
jgi:hypothetical protein